MSRLLRRGACGAAAAALALAAFAAQAQLAEKPSFFTAKRRGEAMAPATAPEPPGAGLRAPGPAAPARPAAGTGPGHLDAITSMAQFRQIARVYKAGSAEPIVHTLFAIDRHHGDRVYLIDTNRFALHEDFIRAQYLVDRLDEATLRSYYAKPDRRFLFGTLSLQPQLKRFTFEFWEGDQADATLIRLAQRRLDAVLFEPVLFKANSMQHEAVARAAGIAAVTEVQILGGRSFLPLNTGRASGRLRLIERLDDDAQDDLQVDDIVVLREVPLSLSPVAGVLTERPSTVLSHVNLLVKGWGVPNAFVRDAFDRLREHDGQWVELRVTDDGYTVQRLASRPPPRSVIAARAVATPDLQQRCLVPLSAVASEGAQACGAKAANLSRIEALRRRGALPVEGGAFAPVPDGFCIPYAHFAQFIGSPAAQAAIAKRLATPGFEQSRRVRRLALEGLRADLAALPVPPPMARQWTARWQQQLHGRSVFVRSSSNSEDLAGFSGAGLYSTVPNVASADAIAAAVRAVWVSVYNTEAYEARRAAGVRDAQVFMGVLVQVAVDSVTSGVMVTRDPFDATHRQATYVSAKRGLGIRVVDGQRVAEQSMHDRWTGAVRRLSRSDEVSELKLGEGGGVVDRPLGQDTPRDVLTDATVRRLAAVGERLKRLFAGADQDIEWAVDAHGDIVVLQSRPYVERKLL